MVPATLVPKRKAATKLKKAAQMTAWAGVRTRVETTVAMELAASWKPLRKSKTRATKIMKMMRANMGLSVGGGLLPVFQHEPLQRVAHVFAAVDGVFDVVV